MAEGDPHLHSQASALVTSSGGVGLCFGCRSAARCTIGVQSERIDAEGVAWFDVVCPSERQGALGVAHGGWTAHVFDEGLGKLVGLQGRFAVTKSLQVRFHWPVPVGHRLLLRVEELGRQGDELDIGGVMTMASSGHRLATGTGRFVLREGDQHFDRFELWLADQ